MKGYDREDAARAIAARLNARAYSDLGIPLDALVRQAIDADLEYMKSAGVLAEDGTMGDAYYDDDDAFEFLLDRICAERGISGERELRIASFLDDYMDAQQAYMDEHGLLGWE